PIVAVSSGRSAAQPAGDMDRSIVRDLFAQAGIVQVDSISELFDCAPTTALPLTAGLGGAGGGSAATPAVFDATTRVDTNDENWVVSLTD
ncbi:hypothetical protein, partial [Nocardia abscessus]|uniref:hypothetical protein n=1 Tax=Nocardia abscessus TaxID=120957 RepID=UPI00245482FD